MNPFLAARAVGISAIPVDTTSKRPLVAWAEYQDHLPDLDLCAEWGKWFEQGRCGIALVCGDVSGRLIAIDIEGVFADRLPELGQRMRDAGLFGVFRTWIEGYCETTPKGGLHVLVRVGGDGRVDGNTKLASATDGHTLIETRGEGGYVIVAPSRNGTAGWEMRSGSLDSITFGPDEEWRAVAAVLASFDEVQPVPPAPLPTSSTPPILRLNESWIDEELMRLGPVSDVLLSRGWTQARSHDSYGQHWVRPDKDPREGHSASLSASDRLYVHSTNAGLPTGNPTLDALDIILCYELGRRPSADERVEFLRARRPAVSPGGGAAKAAETQAAPSSLNLPAEFWQQPEYPFLGHIHAAALARRLSPDAVWEAVKCFYASSIAWNIRLPDDGSLDYISLIVGMSGAGKSRAKQEAYNLLSELWQMPGVRFPVPPGSGEGMTEIFLNRSDDGPKYAYRGIGFYADEGKWLLDVSNRSGNTTMQALKQLWSGELTGSVAATADRHRWLAPRDVRATLLVAATPDVAAQFMRADLTDEGLPQRISWGWAHYPHPDERPAHPGPLTGLQQWTPTQHAYEVEVHPALAADIDAQHLMQSRGETIDGHEGHANYAKLKTAAILGLMRRKLEVSPLDWELSQLDWATTRRIRAYLLSSASRQAVEKNTAIGEARAAQRIAETNVYLEKAVISLVTKLKLATEPLSRRQIKDHLRVFSRRHGVDYREAIALAVQRGIAVEADGGLANR